VEFELSEHAKFQLEQRQIKEFASRWLRVLVNSSHDPKKVVTVFFDRRLK
jgi:hypothetical protein